MQYSVERIHLSPRPRIILHPFYGEELPASCPVQKLEDHLLPTVRNLFFNVFAAAFHTWRPSPPSAAGGHAMPW
jgi:hypothetical protein